MEEIRSVVESPGYGLDLRIQFQFYKIEKTFSAFLYHNSVMLFSPLFDFRWLTQPSFFSTIGHIAINPSAGPIESIANLRVDLKYSRTIISVT